MLAILGPSIAIRSIIEHGQVEDHGSILHTKLICLSSQVNYPNSDEAYTILIFS